LAGGRHERDALAGRHGHQDARADSLADEPLEESRQGGLLGERHDHRRLGGVRVVELLARAPVDPDVVDLDRVALDQRLGVAVGDDPRVGPVGGDLAVHPDRGRRSPADADVVERRAATASGEHEGRRDHRRQQDGQAHGVVPPRWIASPTLTVDPKEELRGHMASIRRWTRSSWERNGSLHSTVRWAWSLSLRWTQSTVKSRRRSWARAMKSPRSRARVVCGGTVLARNTSRSRVTRATAPWLSSR